MADLTSSETNGYAVYIHSVNRYHINSQATDLKKSDAEQSNACLSLLVSNLDAERETLVRCHLLKTFSVSESLGFQNEGRCIQIKSNDDVKDSFGCYYHHLIHDPSDNSSSVDETFPSSKKTSFFICLIGKDDEIMNSFCSELSVFCNRLIPYLEVLEHNTLEAKLKTWYSYCILYIRRCIKNFKCSLVLLFQSALSPKIDVECDDENTRWDLERFLDACSLTNLFQVNDRILTDDMELLSSSSSSKDESSNFTVHLKVEGKSLTCEQNLCHLEHCQKWVDELLLCDPIETVRMRNVLEMFRLKTVRDVNTMKRLLKKAENDYYSLFKAYQFYKVCGCGDVLLHHVKEEAQMTSHREALNIIKSLCDYIEKGRLDI